MIFLKPLKDPSSVVLIVKLFPANPGRNMFKLAGQVITAEAPRSP